LRIKGRQDSKFTLVAASQRQAVRHFPQLQATSYQQLATSNWPGPLSIIVSPRFAIRVPNNRLARQLCQLAGTPLIASSANISGQPTCYSVREFLRQIRTSPVRHRYAQALAGWPRPSFRKERDSKTSPLKEGGSERGVDLILDAGRLPRRPVSTVVRVKRGKVEVVRSGTVKF